MSAQFGEPWFSHAYHAEAVFDELGCRVAKFECIEDSARAVACVNACAGIADPATALQGARDAIAECISGLYAHCAVACGDAIDKATAALAALGGGK